MATIHNFESNGESLTDAVARRLRGLLAEQRIKKTEFAEMLKWDRGYLYRRLSGATALNTADLDEIEHVVGFRADYLIGEHEPKLRPVPPPSPTPAAITRNRRGPARAKSTGWFRDVA